MTDAILDAGPLIHLSELNALDVLNDFSLYLPDVVEAEVAGHRPDVLEFPFRDLNRITITAVSEELRSVARAFALDRGEIAALMYLETHQDFMFLTDDSSARIFAEQKGCRVHGTVGLLVRSVRRGLKKREEIVVILKEIPKRSSLHLKPALLDDIITRVTEEWFG